MVRFIHRTYAHEKDQSMRFSNVTKTPKPYVSLSALSGKDTNLSATSEELTTTIDSLTATIKKLKAS
jgi:hypothetical protein